jgi:voltage-gated potassium channel
MSQLITKPYVIEFLDLLNGVSSQELHLEEIEFDNIKRSFHNKTIGDLNIRAKSGVSIIGVKRGEMGFAFNPGPDTIINQNSILIVLGNKNQIEKFSDLYLNNKIFK